MEFYFKIIFKNRFPVGYRKILASDCVSSSIFDQKQGGSSIELERQFSNEIDKIRTCHVDMISYDFTIH